MSEENKPREFWIRDQVKNFGLHEGARFVAFDSPLGVAYVDGSLHHVVEYKAYEKLQQELESVKAENYRIRCEKQSDLNKIAESEFNENQANDRLKEARAELAAEKAKAKELLEAVENLLGHLDASLLFPHKERSDLVKAESLMRQAIAKYKGASDGQ